MFENGSVSRGLVTTALIKESEIVCDYHTDLVIDQTLLRERSIRHLTGDFGLDATAETCNCHHGRRSFRRLLNYKPSPKPCFRRRSWVMDQNGVRVSKEAISEESLTFCGEDLILTNPSHHVCSPATITDCHRFAQSAKKKNPRSRP